MGKNKFLKLFIFCVLWSSHSFAHDCQNYSGSSSHFELACKNKGCVWTPVENSTNGVCSKKSGSTKKNNRSDAEVNEAIDSKKPEVNAKDSAEKKKLKKRTVRREERKLGGKYVPNAILPTR